MIGITPQVAKAVAVPAVSFLAQKLLIAGSSSVALPSAVAVVAPEVAALALRGGGSPQVLDLTRVRIRLEGLQAYGVVTTLLMNAALRLYSGTPKKLQDGEQAANVAKILFAISMGCSVLAGAYSTVVFALLGLYSKSALGLGKDEAFLEFFAETASIRDMGFHAFVIALISFKASFVLSLFLNYGEGKMRWWASGIAAIVSVLSYYHWSSIMTIAGRLLFS